MTLLMNQHYAMPVRPTQKSGAVSIGELLKASKICCFRRGLPAT
jgi:hypothetical protein